MPFSSERQIKLRAFGSTVELIAIFLGGGGVLVAFLFGAGVGVHISIIVSTFVLLLSAEVMCRLGSHRTGGKSTIYRTERLLVTSGELVIGESYYELPGTVIKGIPNGWCQVTYQATDYGIAGFEIHFTNECGESELDERETLVIDGCLAMIADARGVQASSDVHRVECKRRFENELALAERQAKHSEECLCVLKDAGSKTWAVAFGPVLGDTAYDLEIRRRGEMASTISCEFV